MSVSSTTSMSLCSGLIAVSHGRRACYSTGSCGMLCLWSRHRTRSSSAAGISMNTTGRRYEREMDTPLAKSTDSHAVTSRRQRRTVFGKLLSLHGVQYLHGGAERRPGDGRCGRDGTGCGLKAEEAIDNDDQEGTAMNMGRAVLMAKLLAKAIMMRMLQPSVCSQALKRCSVHRNLVIVPWLFFGGPEVNCLPLPGSVKASRLPTAATSRRFPRSVTRTIGRDHSLQRPSSSGR